MKLIISIIHNEDVNKAITDLNTAGFSVTKLATTGGFLRAGNVTLIVGVEEEKVDEAIKIFEKTCSTRKKIMVSPMSVGMAEIMSNRPIEVDAGGATIFVLDVDRFEKI
ncbi:MAG: cyclic-di-AMP receptor [Clostridia bacterium]|nr:cyclic-di-AMP receptor [Clostridia bacterium]